MQRVLLRQVWTKSTRSLTPYQPQLASYSFRQASTKSSTQTSGHVFFLGSLGSFATLAAALHYSLTTTRRAYCSHASSTEQQQPTSPPLPPLTLYEYPACPFCGKVRAFCDYHNIPYTAVSVNPVSRKEIEFSESKKLPLVIVGSEKIQDSSLIVSVLKTSLERGLGVSECLSFYPLVNVTTSKGENTMEHSNTYFIMYGEERQSRSVGELREEREWREWVDDHLVHTLPPNIYRTLSEARQTTTIISEKSSMTTFQRFLARNVAPFALYFIGRRSIKKYKLNPDVRQSLYDCCNQWVDAVGSDRMFMGGASPNLADLAVFGVLRATKGLPTFRDVQTHSRIGLWYSAMRELVDTPSPMT